MGIDTIIKIAISVAVVGALITGIFAVLPYEYSSFPLATWGGYLDSFSGFLNDILGTFSSFVNITLLLIIVKLFFILYPIGIGIKFTQWVVKLFRY